MADDSSLETSEEFLDRAEDSGGFDESFINGISGTTLAIFGGFIAVIEAFTGLVTGLIDAFTSGGAEWIAAFTTEPAQYIGESFAAGREGFTNTAFAELGPFLPWIGTIVALGVVAMVTFYLGQENEDVPGLGINLPFIENEEEDEN